MDAEQCGGSDQPHAPHMITADGYGLCDCGGLWRTGDLLICDGSGRFQHPHCHEKTRAGDVVQ